MDIAFASGAKGSGFESQRGHLMDYTPDYGRKGKNKGYVIVYCPDHPRAHNGYVYEHILVMESKLGRFVDIRERVHHKNEVKTDNRSENLEVLTLSEHTKLHKSKNPEKKVLLKCAECGKEFERLWHQRPSIKGYKNAYCSRSCSGKASRELQLQHKKATRNLYLKETYGIDFEED